MGYISSGNVINCVNYGTVEGKEYVGGIVGYANTNVQIMNNANFGSVTNLPGNTGTGGIVGRVNSNSCYVLNNYNCGSVYAPEDIKNVGAIVGDDYNENAIIKYNYYLAGCATNKYGNNCGAVGGSADELASSFETLASTMKGTAGEYVGKTLIEALNAWVEANGETYGAVKRWSAADRNGYPLPISKE